MFKDKRLWVAEVIWAEGQGCALPLYLCKLFLVEINIY